jgi:hypothetical protein
MISARLSARHCARIDGGQGEDSRHGNGVDAPSKNGFSTHRPIGVVALEHLFERGEHIAKRAHCEKMLVSPGSTGPADSVQPGGGTDKVVKKFTCLASWR